MERANSDEGDRMPVTASKIDDNGRGRWQFSLLSLLAVVTVVALLMSAVTVSPSLTLGAVVVAVFAFAAAILGALAMRG